MMKLVLFTGLRGEERNPYLDDHGKLRIPLDADDKYRYWSDGQSVFATLLDGAESIGQGD